MLNGLERMDKGEAEPQASQLVDVSAGASTEALHEQAHTMLKQPTRKLKRQQQQPKPNFWRGPQRRNNENWPSLEHFRSLCPKVKTIEGRIH